MNGLRPYARDRELPVTLGDADLALPGDDELRALVGEHLLRDASRAVSAVDLEFARWKPHTSITATWDVRFDDGTHDTVTLKRYSDGKARDVAASYVADARAEEGASPLRAFAASSDGRTCLWRFPADRVLPGAARVLDVRRTARIVNGLELFDGLRVRRRASRTSLVRYKPERRAVFLLDVALRGPEGERGAAKLGVRALPPAAAARVAEHRGLLVAEGVHLPELLLHEPDSGILVERWIDGETVAPDDFSDAADAGHLLARFHRAHPGPAVRSTWALRGSAALLAQDAECARHARALGSLEIVSRTWIHGDFHPDQLQRGASGRVEALLDLDALRPGEPAEDIASWIADALAEDPERDLGECAAPLLAGYREAGGEVDDALVADLTARGLVQRAAAALRRLELDGLRRARRLVAQASRAGEQERIR